MQRDPRGRVHITAAFQTPSFKHISRCPLAVTTEGGGRWGAGSPPVTLLKLETSVFAEANANVVALDGALDEQVDPR